VAEHELVIRNGTVVDGSGGACYRADVGIVDGRISTIGRVRGRGHRELDAEGHVVTPGFIDGHTHMDAQVFWDRRGTCSCWHGVTTVVMGNCGFTLAPARSSERHLVVRNLERAEDISPAALAAGIDWSWEGYDGYLDAVEAAPKAINYAGYVGHSALRTWAMGERAFTADATDEDIAVMREELRRALVAGAVGLSTSRSETHLTSDDRPVASRIASWPEVAALVDVVGEFDGTRLFEISVEQGASDTDAGVRNAVFERMGDLAVATGVPVTFGIISPGDDFRSRGLLDLIDRTHARGGRMFGQSLPREATIVLSFLSRLPYDKLAVWSDLRALPIDAQRQRLRDPELRAALVHSAHGGPYLSGIGATVRPPDYDKIRAVLDPVGPNPTLAQVAAQRRLDPVEALIELSLEHDLDQFFTQNVGNDDEKQVLEILHHPRTVMTFSDSGAHVGYIMESSIQSYLLAYWVRQRQEFTLEEAVRMMTAVPATAWGFFDRGILREGMAADINVFDPEMVGPGPLEVDNDLPTGVSRLKQRAVGFKATIVGGEIVLRDGQHTDALPGRLLRRTSWS
jgi:N-acyl-D-aspartate/D-glutamate deacylase